MLGGVEKCDWHRPLREFGILCVDQRLDGLPNEVVIEWLAINQLVNILQSLHYNQLL